MEKSETYVISIMSQDRVGIVYDVSKAISDLDGNIADIRQSVLCGFFTMILLASFPVGVSQRDIERKLAEVDAHNEMPIDAAIKKVEKGNIVSEPPHQENTYVLTATGTDKIGFVATVTSFCVKHRLNILDLSTTEADGAYIMILIIDLNHEISIGEVRKDLAFFSNETGVKTVLQHHDIFKAVNDINLSIR
jgi:glycine cleavage system transcriptional repressor